MLAVSFRTALATSLILCVIAAPVASSSSLRSDFDDSGVVDFTDFLVFADTFNRSAAHPAFDLRADFDNSGTVDFSDFLIFAEDFGNTAPDVGNDIGNGLEIIHGPDGPDGPDRDNPFRSLTVHPLDANTVLMGTERNGFVKSVDGGQTWTRHRLGLRHHSAGYRRSGTWLTILATPRSSMRRRSIHPDRSPERFRARLAGSTKRGWR